MRLEDIAPVEKWEALERELHETSGLNACVYNAEGTRITSYTAFANRLCPHIKSFPAGIETVCAVANQHCANMVRESGTPYTTECDAGLVKFVVPIVQDGEFLGTIGGCGHRLPDSEVETFLLTKSLGTPEEELEAMAAEVQTITQNEIDLYIKVLQSRLAELTPH